MIPSPWVALVLLLGAFRATRIVGWDTLPLLERARAWASGEEIVRVGDQNAFSGLSQDAPIRTTSYRRPTVAKLLDCPWCLGFWVGVGTYVAWVFAPTATLYAAAPLALAAGVGLVARWFDP